MRQHHSKRPRVTVNCPADVYASPGERIVEFSFADGSGGLISLREGANGHGPSVEIYRQDASITVLPSSVGAKREGVTGETFKKGYGWVKTNDEAPSPEYQKIAPLDPRD